MRRYALRIAVLAAMLLVSVLAGTSSANVWVKDTHLSIHMMPSGQVDPGDRVLIHGRLKPQACQEGQRIRLMKVVPGPNEVLKSDRTDGNGEYSFRLHPDNDMKVYARFAGSVDDTYAHSHTCLKSTSEKLTIHVSG